MTEDAKTPAIVVRVLNALLNSTDALDGLSVAAQAGQLRPRVYAALARLEDRGWVESDWEAGAPARTARRRVYRLTPGGAIAAAHTVEEARAVSGSLALGRRHPVAAIRRLPALLRGTR